MDARCLAGESRASLNKLSRPTLQANSGVWLSGRASVLHTEGPVFDPRFVHIDSISFFIFFFSFLFLLFLLSDPVLKDRKNGAGPFFFFFFFVLASDYAADSRVVGPLRSKPPCEEIPSISG